MMRFVAMLLALMLPLQSAWAAVGAYCQHEASPQAARHFGHHAHVHKTDVSQAEGKTASDSDCSICHAGSAATVAATEPHAPELPTTAAWVPATATHPSSALARAPDRPQWLRLA